MTNPPVYYLTSFIKTFIATCLTILFLAVQPAFAEPFLYLNNRAREFKIPEVVRLNVKRHPIAGINSNGDFIIRCGDISLTIAYNPFSDRIEPQQRTSVFEKESPTSINGISLKVAFMF